MGETLKKDEVLRTRREIERVFREGHRVSGDIITLWYCKGDHRRFGFLVFRGAGRAVDRNRWRRWLREVCRRNKGIFPNYCDYLLVVRKPKKVGFAVLRDEVLSLANRVLNE
jgi:ribonuclease P protein component